MSHDVISFKVDPELKALAEDAAAKLHTTIEKVLAPELRRFAAEQRTIFTLPEMPHEQVQELFANSQKQIAAGSDVHSFDSNEEALSFLTKELQ